jgi:hypothetical protein
MPTSIARLNSVNNSSGSDMQLKEYQQRSLDVLA